ncbi:MAG TPA: alpha/beta fold hydrolase [Acidimicrobiia bacterium]|nr:alpha/beta fold hydrolase [Acidimicrobiia bacterium]
MRVVSSGGTGLVAEREGEGPPFLMVHGFTGAKEDFADHAPCFARHSTVITYDLRGHGESDHPSEVDSYSFDLLTADALAVADACAADQFVLLGHSMGGMVALRVVLEHPERVAGLVLMDTAPGKPQGVDADMAEVAAQLALEDGMAELRRLLDAANPLGSEADQRVRAERPGYAEFGERKWAAVEPAAYATLLREIVHQQDQLDAMREITCPTLVIVGEQDEPFLEDSYAMVEAIDGAELVVVPRAGHSPQFENPDVWYAAVDAFVREVTT